MPEGTQILAPSAVAAKGEMYTDKEGMQPLPTPVAMSTQQIEHAVQEYARAAEFAMDADFDGVEIHGANGYLVEQFINPGSNRRTDNYGGSIENRSRFTLEVVKAIVEKIGYDKVGIRLSPHGVFNDMLGEYPELEETYRYIAEKLKEMQLLYVHLVDHSKMGAPEVPKNTVDAIRSAFQGNLILSGGYELMSAEEALESKRASLIAFGRPFISNPDLPRRFDTNTPLSDPDSSTFYTPGEKGYTDYPFAAVAKD